MKKGWDMYYHSLYPLGSRDIRMSSWISLANSSDPIGLFLKGSIPLIFRVLYDNSIQNTIYTYPYKTVYKNINDYTFKFNLILDCLIVNPFNNADIDVW